MLLCGLFSICGELGLLSICGGQASHCGGFSYCGAKALGAWGSVVVVPGLYRLTGSIVVAHRLSCPVACRIFLDRGLNLCLLHWQADSLPLSHQYFFYYYYLKNIFTYLTVPGLSCGSLDFYLWHSDSYLQRVGSHCLTRDQTRAPCIGSMES